MKYIYDTVYTVFYVTPYIILILTFCVVSNYICMSSSSWIMIFTFYSRWDIRMDFNIECDRDLYTVDSDIRIVNNQH